MDPLSLISSCVSIIDGVEKLYRFARENIHSSASVRAQLSALIARCSACKGIIEGVQLQAQLDADSKSRLFLLDHVSEPICALEGAIKLMTDKIQKLPRSIVFGKVLGSSINDCLKTFDDTLRILQLALHADQFSILNITYDHVRQVKADVSSLNATMNQLSKDVSELRLLASDELSSQKTEQEEKRRAELRAWLSNLDATQLYRSLAEKAYSGTGSWFVDRSFDKWLRQREKPKRVLWLQGRSGMGKTTLVTTAITKLMAQYTTHVFAYFFFSSSIGNTQTLQNFLGSILVQLCDQKPELWHGIRAWRDDLANQHQGMIEKPGVDEILAVLKKICGNFEEVILILDAPNECESPKKVLAAIGSLLSDIPNSRLLVSSTPDLNIPTLIYEGLLVVDMNTADINVDIGEYVRARMEDEEQLEDFPTHLKNLVLTSLIQRAEGSFRWVECQLSAIAENASSEAAMYQTLENLSSDLEELYTKVLTDISPQQSKLVRTALLWLVFATRPLHIDEIRESMILREDTSEVNSTERLLPGKAEALLSKCRILINYNASSKSASIAHSSVRDFLLSDSCRSGRAGYYHLDYSISICDLACLTVGYLNMEVLSGGYVTSRFAYEERLQNCPLLSYAADFWPLFTQNVDWTNKSHRSRIETPLQFFFDSSGSARGSNFSSWIQVYEPRHLRRPLDVSENQPLSTPLYYAARSGMTQVAGMILRVYGKDALETPGGSRQSTPLHVAAAYGRLSMVQLLLQQGANPNERNMYRERGVAWAEYHEYPEIVQLYLDFGASPLKDDDRQRIWSMH